MNILLSVYVHPSNVFLGTTPTLYQTFWMVKDASICRQVRKTVEEQAKATVALGSMFKTNSAIHVIRAGHG